VFGQAVNDKLDRGQCVYSLRKVGDNGGWVGVIFFNDRVSIARDIPAESHLPTDRSYELVSISRGNVVEGPQFHLHEEFEEERPRQPDGALYEFITRYG
jgi:hypothetical protein